MQSTFKILFLYCVLVIGVLPARAQQDTFASDTLKKLNLEELLNLEVTSVSKQAEKLLEAPSAVQVITSDDIRRSGASSIPEALRLATNLHVAQKNAHDWAISARGFNTDLANKLLVLIDGRTVYTPLFSGVFWDRQDYLLEDIERIEVISGPGSTLWGANAVNGVINIITKNATDTQGLYVEAGGGNELRKFAGARYGSKLGEKTSVRIYGKFFDRDEAVLTNGDDAADSWRMGQGGFRLDAKPSEKNILTLQSDAYGGLLNLSGGGNTNVNGGNILGRWSHTFSENSTLNLQLYYDRTSFVQDVPESRTEDNIVMAPAGVLKDQLDTYDLDVQYNLQLGQRNRLVSGVGYRFTHDEVQNAPALGFSPEVLDRNLFNIFVQDELTLTKKIFLTLGTKIEHNDYTGFEYEPSARTQVNLSTKHTLWAAISRAVRMPSRIDRDVRLPTPAFAPIIENLLIGGANFQSENVVAYELGFRSLIGTKITASLATFYNVYSDVRSTSQSPPDMFGLTFPLFYENNLEGETWGLDASTTYQVSERWRLVAGYALLHEDIRVKQGATDFNQALNETADPKNRFSIQSYLDILPNFELNAGFRFVDSFQFSDAGTADQVSSYTDLNIKIAWRPIEKIELSITGQNLLHAHHAEYVPSKPNPAEEIERSLYAKVAWKL